jgi:DNA-binding GntR family transcriptional regulator
MEQAAGKKPPLAPSRLQANLARRILQLLKEKGVSPGYHLVEQELCLRFGVSRTPVRGALNLLAAQGMVEARANRGFVLVEPVKDIPDEGPLRIKDDEAKQLMIAIAHARNSGTLADTVAQQELVRRFNVRLPIVVQVLRQMAEMGLVERKEGNGWSFGATIHSAEAQAQSYVFRRVIEPGLLLLPGFALDRAWAEKTKASHAYFRSKQWRETDAVDFYEVNADFHEHLARCSGNRYMIYAVQRQIQLRRFLNYEWDYGVERVHESIDEHMEILALLEAGRNDQASAMMLDHLGSSARVEMQTGTLAEEDRPHKSATP